MIVKMLPIVEGPGEVHSVPIILRRLALEVESCQVEIFSPIRIPRDRFVREGETERAVELAARHVGGAGGIVIVMDADDDLPCDLGPRLLARARARRSDVPIAVVLAKCELEAWFLASIESLRGQRGVREDAEAPSNPESIRGAKGVWSLIRPRSQRRLILKLHEGDPPRSASFLATSAECLRISGIDPYLRIQRVCLR